MCTDTNIANTICTNACTVSDLYPTWVRRKWFKSLFAVANVSLGTRIVNPLVLLRIIIGSWKNTCNRHHCKIGVRSIFFRFFSTVFWFPISFHQITTYTICWTIKIRPTVFREMALLRTVMVWLYCWGNVLLNALFYHACAILFQL